VVLGAACLLGLLAAPAAAQYAPATWISSSVPSGVNYQGRLEEQGAVVNGQRLLRFKLYDTPRPDPDETLYWDSGEMVLDVKKGVFGTILDIPYSALRGAGQRYLEVSVEYVALSPRDPLRAVPYARVAETVEGTLDIMDGGLTVKTSSGLMALYASSATGNVGIGTQGSYSRLTVSSSVSAGAMELFNPTDAAGAGMRVLFDFEADNDPGSYAALEVRNTDPAPFPGTYMTLHTRSVGALGERVRITQAGDVGIGTSAPEARLHVSSGTLAPLVVVSHASQPQMMLRRGGNVMLLGYGPSVGRVGTQITSPLILAPNEVERVRILANGDTGIRTSNPLVPLHLIGVLRASRIETMAAGSAGSPSLFFGEDADTGFFAPAADSLAMTTDGGESLRVDSNGRMGIGTTDPAGMTLKVTPGDVQLGAGVTAGSAAPDLFVEGNTRVNGSIFQTGGQSSFTVVSVATTAIPTQIFKVGEGWLTALSEGRVGISTTTPAYPLHIVGAPLSLSHASTPELRLQAANADVLFARAVGSVGTVGTFGAHQLHLGAQGADILRVHETSAWVGVNKNPLQALDVQGDMQAGAMLLPNNPLAIDQGGTGAGTADGARDNFEAVNRDGTNVFVHPTDEWPINVSGSAEAADYLDKDGADCALAGTLFPRGFDVYLAAQFCEDAAAGMSLGDEGVLGSYVYDNDNALGGPWTVASPNGGNYIDFDADDHTFYVDHWNNRVGIGTNAPATTVDVVGDLSASGKLQEGGSDLIPAGAISFTSGTVCPDGWEAFSGADGRYIMGLIAGSPGLQQGIALTDGEDRLLGIHNHTYNGASVADHTHPVGCSELNSPTHGHTFTGNAMGTHTHPLSCSANHGHSFTCDSGGTHAHGIANDSHTHGVVMDGSPPYAYNYTASPTQARGSNTTAVYSSPTISGVTVASGGAHDISGTVGLNSVSMGTPSCTLSDGGAHTPTGDVDPDSGGIPTCSTSGDPQGGYMPALSINNAGTGTSTNAPYIQLLVCRKQ